MLYQFLDAAPLAIFALGALTFSIVTASYWRERRRGVRGASAVLPMFTLVCAAAFLNSLVSQLIAPAVVPSILFRNLTAGLLPALMLHLVFEIASPGLAHRGAWFRAVRALYGAGIASTLAKGLDDTGLVSVPWGEAWYRAPAACMAAAASVGLLLLAASRRPVAKHELAYRRWLGALLTCLLFCSAAGIFGMAAILEPIPDYLLLAFFCISLYYRERLAFFDLLVKRGMFLLAGVAILTATMAAAARLLPGEAPWTAAAGMLLSWLLGPWVYRRLSRAIDRLWLRRPYSPADAERRFIRDIQAAAAEEELRSRAAASLEGLFQTAAEVRFDGRPAHSAADAESLTAILEQHDTCLGSILLHSRSNGVPFLSDDRRLAQSLAGTLAVVLENVRFRADRRRQEEREQQLQWLASRAELKALRAQINPHFLFNALSVIAGLLHYQPELADATIEQLGQVFRYALGKSGNEWSPLAEEVAFVTAYLRIEQARFGERLQVSIDVEPAAAQVLIPAMSIQPLIENAIRHGVSAREEGGRVALHAVLGNGILSVEVSDNGSGFPPGFSLDGHSEGHGLRNVQERLRGYYGDSAALGWQSGRTGTRVLLTVPQSAPVGEEVRHARADC